MKAADTALDWKEFTSPDGRKYYHNRKTKESKWTMPEEMKKAQEEKAAAAAAAPAAAAAAAAQKASAVSSTGVKAGGGPPPLVKVPVASTPSPARAVADAAKVSSQSCQDFHPCINAHRTPQLHTCAIMPCF